MLICMLETTLERSWNLTWDEPIRRASFLLWHVWSHQSAMFEYHCCWCFMLLVHRLSLSPVASVGENHFGIMMYPSCILVSWLVKAYLGLCVWQSGNELVEITPAFTNLWLGPHWTAQTSPGWSFYACHCCGMVDKLICGSKPGTPWMFAQKSSSWDDSLIHGTARKLLGSYFSLNLCLAGIDPYLESPAIMTWIVRGHDFAAYVSSP